MTALQKRLDEALRHITDLPLLPSFDWADVATRLSNYLKVPISIEEKGADWKPNIHDGMGKHPQVLPIDLTPLPGRAAWIMSSSDCAKFTSWLMTEKVVTRRGMSDGLHEGFFLFLALEAAEVLQPLFPVTVAFGEEEPEGSCFCLDLSIRFGEAEMWGRLALSQDLYKKWQEMKGQASILARMPKTHLLNLRLRMATLPLSPQALAEAHPGDAIPLPPGSWDPRHAIGHVMLLLGDIPIANLKLSEGRAEVAEAPLLLETGLTVEKGAIEMTIEQLLSLQPGTSLDLPVADEASWDIRSEGATLRQGHLIYLGEIPCLKIS